MAKVLIFTSYLDNSGQPKQVASLVGYLAKKPDVSCTVFAGFESKPQFYDDFIKGKTKLLVKKDLTQHPLMVVNYLCKKSKAIKKFLLYQQLQKLINNSTSFHVFGLSVFNFIHKYIDFEHVYLWHNTHMIQYTHDENAFVFPPFSSEVLKKITFVIVHPSMHDELAKHYGPEIKIVVSKLFYND